MSAVEFNAGSWLTHRHVEEGRGDRAAVRGGAGLTYAELSDLVGIVTAGLRSLGLRRDDRVVFVTNDDVPMFTGILAAFCGGFVAVPVSTMLGARELGEIIADSGASVVVVSAEYEPQIEQAVAMAPELRHLVCDGDAALTAPAWATSSTWAELVAAGERESVEGRAPAATSEDSWALWLYTSGTTGSPKGAMHRHANIRHVCETYGDQVLGIRPDDVCFSIAKLFFAYGIGNSMFFPLSVGAATVLEPRRPSPAVVAERVAADRPTLFFGVPTFYAALVVSDLPDDAFAPVRLGASAGEALPAALQERFTRRFGVEIIDGIGSTEALHIFLSNRPGEIRPGTTGRPVPGYDIELRDADGQKVPDGEPGSLYVRGESIALGYWRRADASRTVFAGEWLSTGDTYVRTVDGFYACMGRSNDLLKAGGIWVSPAEVESRLLEHDAVAEAAVVGVSDAHGLDKPVACVVTSGEVTAEELVQWCRDGLASFKRPREIVFVDALPKTATGKMQRFKVRQMVADITAAPSADHTAEAAPTSEGAHQ
ncbi:benzoate-CoA ligase family protein [Microtetraspora sp. NBRC 16547]|uniref:benzoate-CoA ligase family protein n=1 Tax=Microtetraspora sp. NBRC 16547 TaxID=3030993 RepID=UPI0024A335D6|nr:benzoate-CoA ligase family protein [Microtetraspora sp. NBRC 16547]GLW98517.1 benzoate--CoA ligase [Microtetraspora sp. NBRC 16547]